MQLHSRQQPTSTKSMKGKLPCPSEMHSKTQSLAKLPTSVHSASPPPLPPKPSKPSAVTGAPSANTLPR